MKTVSDVVGKQCCQLFQSQATVAGMYNVSRCWKQCNLADWNNIVGRNIIGGYVMQ